MENQPQTTKKIFPRARQRKAAKAIVENMMLDNPKNQGEVLESIGYSKTSAETPSVVINSPGFRVALAEMGLTPELITNALVEDIKEKKKNRLGELRLGAEILGINKPENEPEKPKSNNTYNFIFTGEVKKEIKNLEDKIEVMLTQKRNVQ